MVDYAVVNRWMIGRGEDRDVNGESRNSGVGRRAAGDTNVQRLLTRPPGEPSRRPVVHVESIPRSEVVGNKRFRGLGACRWSLQ